jgi:dGTPase
MRIMGDAEELVRRLFHHYRSAPKDMPPEWTEGLDPAAVGQRALRVADFIAGMTDRYAMVEHTRLFGSTPDLR